MVLQLFALVGESISGATHAFLAGDREAAKALADRDEEVVDTLYHDIEDLTLRQLTVAGITSPEDLRFLVTVIRMLPDLERNGDLAEHIARRAARGLGGESRVQLDCERSVIGLHDHAGRSRHGPLGGAHGRRRG